MADASVRSHLTPLTLVNSLGLASQATSTTPEDACSFLQSLMEDGVCTMENLQVAFHDKRLPKKYFEQTGTYLKLLKNPVEPGKGSKTHEFLQQGKALHLLVKGKSKEELEQCWSGKQLGERFMDSIDDPFLETMKKSPLYNELLKKKNSPLPASLASPGRDRPTQEIAVSGVGAPTEARAQAQPEDEDEDDGEDKDAQSPADVSFVSDVSVLVDSDLDTTLPMSDLDITTSENHSDEDQHEGLPQDLSQLSTPTTPSKMDLSYLEGIQDLLERNKLDQTFLSNAYRLLRRLEQSKVAPLGGSFYPPLKLCSWNTLKMGLMGKAKTFRDSLLFELSICDIICLQEVPHSDKTSEKSPNKSPSTDERRIDKLREELNSITQGEKFSLLLSTPSGKGQDAAKKEVHAILYHNSWRLVKHTTLTDAGLDYAPLIAQFEHSTHPEFAFFFTSVHLPPEGRRLDRDTQLARFPEKYRDAITTHFKHAITYKGAKDANKKTIPVHVIMGDFNSAPKLDGFFNAWGEKYQQFQHTSKGGRSFDHFYLNSDATSSFEAKGDVLHLTFDSESLSDHSPIILQLTKQPKLPPGKELVASS